MSTLEETTANTTISLPVTGDQKESLLSRFLGAVCSVRLGIILLILLGLACLVGMLIMQQNVAGFERYYAELAPSQRLVYGKLGLFDIYHAWYFNSLLAFLSLNIILASVDRFPITWKFASKPMLDASAKWLRNQKPGISFSVQGKEDEIISRVKQSFKSAGWRKSVITEKGGRTVVFSESGLWNRFGAYAVHVGLLTIFFGGFLTSQLGYTGNMPLSPGQSSNNISELDFDLDQLKQVNKDLPFEVYCTDIQQKLIKKEESISASNTIDWLTSIQIKDETGTHDAVVSMNRPFDYRGYRFFQASFVSVGRARNISLRAENEAGENQELTIKRDGTTTLPNGTSVRFVNFRGNFSAGKEDLNEDTSSYPNPAAILQVTPPNGAPETAFAFGEKLKDIPIAGKFVGGYKFELLDFEKVSEQHILSVQRDPGATVVYIGFILLMITLGSVFFFSHQRVWAVIEEVSKDHFNIVAGGNTNRNQTALEEKFKRFAKDFKNFGVS
jgi:cytochrome c biogenesis protein